MEQPTHSAYSSTTSPNITQVPKSLFLSDFGTLARSAVLIRNITPDKPARP